MKKGTGTFFLYTFLRPVRSSIRAIGRRHANSKFCLFVEASWFANKRKAEVHADCNDENDPAIVAPFGQLLTVFRKGRVSTSRKPVPRFRSAETRHPARTWMLINHPRPPGLSGGCLDAQVFARAKLRSKAASAHE